MAAVVRTVSSAWAEIREALSVYKNISRGETMATRCTTGLVLASAVFLAGCVSQKEHDALQAKYDSAQASNRQLQTEVGRLRGAIRYTVNSDLLFPPGSWEMSADGKDIIAKMASQLAPTQQNRIVVNGYTDDAPVGARLQRQGITSNQILSEKRAENVMKFLISRGVNPELVSSRGFGEQNPIAPNNTAHGRAQNRRVELTLAGSGN